MNQIECPICHSSCITPKKGYKRGEFQLCMCHDCGLGFIAPLPSREELHQYYTNTYPLVQRAEQLLTEIPTHEDTQKIVTIIKEMNPEADWVCEIGCAFGSLLAGLRQQGFRVKGFEFSESLSAIARERFKLDVESGEIPSDLGGKFDVVIERHVLEHVLNPSQELQRIGRALHPGGIVILITQNSKSLASRICGPGWQWFGPPDHLYYFDYNSLTSLLYKNGFSCEAWFTRKGDANNIIFAFIQSIWTRARPPKFSPGFWKGQKVSYSHSHLPRPVVNSLIAITEIIWKLISPVFSVLNKRGLGEELWCIARKQPQNVRTIT